MKIYGLTGGIASGKSSVGIIFRKLGVPVVDADEIARTLRAPGGKAHEHIQKRFGTNDSKKLRQIIASDPKAKKDLEQMMHPLIQAESSLEFKRHQGKVPYLIYEAALIVETGRYKELDGLIVVTCDDDFRLMRLTERDQVDMRDARQFINAQGDLSEQEKVATHVINNDGTLEDLAAKVRELHLQLRMKN